MALLYLGIGRSLFIGQGPRAAMHRHRTLEIALSLDRPFSFRTSQLPWRSSQAIAISPGVPHEFRDSGSTVASMLLVAEKRWASRLRETLFARGPVSLLEDSSLDPYRAFFRSLSERETDCAEVFGMCERLVELIAGIEGYRGSVDERILRVLETIDRELPLNLHSRALARTACLSEGRFLHLFADQLGISVRQYIMDQRLHRATRGILTGASVTRAAVDAGFSDSSHFTRTFIQLAGIRPSQLKSFRGRVRVFSCGSPYCVRPTEGHPSGGPCRHCGLYTAERDSS